MKNIVLAVLFAGLGLVSFIKEPVADTTDIIAGATSTTYNPLIDDTASASTSYNDDEYEYDDDEYEHEDDEHEDDEHEDDEHEYEDDDEWEDD